MTQTNEDLQIALVIGAKHYRGKACALHPSALRYVHNKACIECERIKGALRKLANADTERERKKAWKAANPDRVAAEKARYAARHRAKITARAKAREATDPRALERKRVSALAAQWRQYERQEERRIAREKARAESEAKHREVHAMRYAASMLLDMHGQPMTANGLRSRCKRGKHRAKALGCRVGLTATDIKRIGDAQGWRCAHCGHRSSLTLDHIKPLALGGHHIGSNVQWLCWFHNKDKHAMAEDDYRRLRGIPERTPWDAPRTP